MSRNRRMSQLLCSFPMPMQTPSNVSAPVLISAGPVLRLKLRLRLNVVEMAQIWSPREQRSLLRSKTLPSCLWRNHHQHHHHHRHFIVITTTTSAPKPHNDHVVVPRCSTPYSGELMEPAPRVREDCVPARQARGPRRRDEH